jgi:hypothetical protein
VYEVSCKQTGQFQIKIRGEAQGHAGHCTGEINGGDAEIQISIKWKQLW